eukprot:CAMPEP_0205826196 /NCGR_PEP_ID=MMETSP0206-20130828/27927_1 /ASSEMBLY_ACC=CAM_ASM_000279 /TAXON_ID=36767 /ORGANISM="Euplotes focardii, Strain TN1" /LENGTH=280 /DNA_ID=CAMNT_0053125933 /DNA_START=12 /DNA_END=854 /DNA_ORIENTATION=-
MAEGQTFKCRMHEEELPEANSMVIVRVNKVEEYGAFVSLLEYNNIEGMILSSEVSRKRIRSIHKHLRIGKQDVMQVLRVDKDKGYIDLSKKYVTEEDVRETTERYAKSKTVHSIMKHVAVTCNIDLEELLREIAWPLYEEYETEDGNGHALTGLQDILLDESKLEKYKIQDEVKTTLLKEITHRLAEQPVKVQARIEVTCFTPEGIDAIKPALRAGIAVGDEKRPVEINLQSTPIYRVSTHCMDKQSGINLLNDAIAAIKAEITKSKGKMAVKEAPVCVE